MKLLLSIFSVFGLSLFHPAFIQAHETEEVHTEPPANIDPAAAIIVVVVIAVLGFLLWKFVLNKKESSPMQPK